VLLRDRIVTADPGYLNFSLRRPDPGSRDATYRMSGVNTMHLGSSSASAGHTGGTSLVLIVGICLESLLQPEVVTTGQARSRCRRLAAPCLVPQR
jgi:hypothetical protein